MTVDSKTEHVIDVELFEEGHIATILLKEDGKPEIKEAKEEYKKDIQNILDDIRDQFFCCRIGLGAPGHVHLAEQY